MKAVAKLLTDPHLHVLVAAILIVRFATGDEESTSVAGTSAPPRRCVECRHYHSRGVPCPVPSESIAARPDGWARW